MTTANILWLGPLGSNDRNIQRDVAGALLRFFG